MKRTSLHNIRVLDLSRVLAGPYCTQILGDLGAEIIKVERPGTGDDTRSWGPPFLQNKSGADTSESAYYLSCNRNKQSIALDIANPEGQKIIHRLLEHCDVLIENFKVDGLKKYGLSYEQLREQYPHLVYCSITGFGQTGPLAHEPGYDFLAQGMAGLMACTGEPGGQPMKVGVALSDIMTGMNAAIGILAALHARQDTGKGQHIDVALTDCTLSAMTNIAQYYLTSGRPAPRLGNAHSTIVPYQVFEAEDGHIILAVGNDGQFARFAAFAGHPEWAENPKYARNRDRVLHRAELVPEIVRVIKAHSMAHWIDGLNAHDVPCGPVNTMDKVFEMEQINARDMRIEMDHPYAAGPVPLVGSPLKLSDTPVSYERHPPVCGEHTAQILKTLLGLSEQDLETLQNDNVIALGGTKD